MSRRKCNECGQVHLAGVNGAIYCCGPLLRAVQMSGMFKDSKYFVDMSCRYSPERVLADFQLFSSVKKNETSIKHLTNFVDNHFDQPGLEMEYWCPPDWRSEPAFVGCIKDPQLKKFAIDLNAIWKQLGRSIKDSVRTSPHLYSLVYVPNPIIVSSGRAIEFYYWDTYWIVRGLLYSGMHQTARGMIENLLYLVNQYKTLPMGGRIYYWGRSHPPMLVAMVKAYVDVTKDQKFATAALPLLETEMDHFLATHAVTVEGRTMYRYFDTSVGPRPEAYREDMYGASDFGTECERNEHYTHLKAACESGQDFSSRWYVSPNGNNVGTMANIKTTWIIPVDLNCILFRNCKTLAEFNNLAENKERAQKYRAIACGLIKAITTVLWNEDRGVWFDYDMNNRKQRDYFVVTNLSPLWLHAYPIADSEKISESVMAYIEQNNLDSYPGGVPHTLSNTGQQWDYPNVWPQMMYMLTEGLNNLGTPEAVEMSKRWRDRWIKSNCEFYAQTGLMYESYNCEGTKEAVSADDSQNQTGFGWTNAVLIEMLARYGHDMSGNIDCPCPCTQMDTDLADCIITSEAYMESLAEDEQNATNDQDNGSDKVKSGCARIKCKAQDTQSITTSERRCPPPLQRSNPYGLNQCQSKSAQATNTNDWQSTYSLAQNKSAQATYATQEGCGRTQNDYAQPSCQPTAGCGHSQNKAAQATSGWLSGYSLTPDNPNKSAQTNYGARDCCGQVEETYPPSNYGPRYSYSQAQDKSGSPGSCNRPKDKAAQAGYGSPGGCNHSQDKAAQAGYGSPVGCNQSQDKAAQATKGWRDSYDQTQDQQALKKNIPSKCSVCYRLYCQQEGVLCPNPEPIDIEIDDVDNIFEQSKFELEEAESLYPCPSAAQNDEEEYSFQEDQDCRSCREDMDGSPSANNPPPKAAVFKNKIFPLADGRKCPLPEEEPQTDTESCACDFKPRKKECE